MVKGIMLLMGGCFCCLVYAQNSLLDKYDFSEGGYSLVIVSSNHPSKREFFFSYYTNDIAVLNEYKVQLVVEKEAASYRCACFEDYSISICRYGNILEQFSVSTNCKSITSLKGSHAFISFLDFNRLQNTSHRRIIFDSRNEALDYLKLVSRDTNLLMMDQPPWQKFEGEFSFPYEHTSYDTELIRAELQKEISSAYPHELFEITDVQTLFGSTNLTYHYLVYVTCNKKLFDVFNLYPKRERVGWKYYDLLLDTYWTH